MKPRHRKENYTTIVSNKEAHNGKGAIVARSGLDSFHTIMDTIQLHYDEILNYYNHRSTNASAEQLNSKIRTFRKSLRGVHDLSFFFFRLTKIYA